MRLKFFILLALLVPFLSKAESAVELYLKEIKPLFEERCFACHGALKQKGKLRVDTVSFMHEKGIIEDGELFARLSTDDEDDIMPPEGHPLSAKELAVVKKWLAAGAPAPENEKPEANPNDHWAYQKINRPAVPQSNEKNAIDAFIETRLKEENLMPQNQAERSLLIRRLYLDLIGLPPTLKQLEDNRSLEEIIDSLFASQHYGERWGRTGWMSGATATGMA